MYLAPDLKTTDNVPWHSSSLTLLEGPANVTFALSAINLRNGVPLAKWVCLAVIWGVGNWQRPGQKTTIPQQVPLLQGTIWRLKEQLLLSPFLRTSFKRSAVNSLWGAFGGSEKIEPISVLQGPEIRFPKMTLCWNAHLKPHHTLCHTLSHLYILKYAYDSQNFISYFYQVQDLRLWFWTHCVFPMDSEIQTAKSKWILKKLWFY